MARKIMRNLLFALILVVGLCGGVMAEDLCPHVYYGYCHRETPVGDCEVPSRWLHEESPGSSHWTNLEYQKGFNGLCPKCGKEVPVPNSLPKENEWEKVALNFGSGGTSGATERLKVPGGWLYKNDDNHNGSYGMAMCFVPEPKQEVQQKEEYKVIYPESYESNEFIYRWADTLELSSYAGPPIKAFVREKKKPSKDSKP